MFYIQWTNKYALEPGKSYLTQIARGAGKSIKADWGTLYAAKSFDTEQEAFEYMRDIDCWKGIAIPTFIHPSNWHTRCKRGDV